MSKNDQSGDEEKNCDDSRNDIKPHQESNATLPSSPSSPSSIDKKQNEKVNISKEYTAQEFFALKEPGTDSRQKVISNQIGESHPAVFQEIQDKKINKSKGYDVDDLTAKAKHSSSLLEKVDGAFRDICSEAINVYNQVINKEDELKENLKFSKKQNEAHFSTSKGSKNLKPSTLKHTLVDPIPSQSVSQKKIRDDQKVSQFLIEKSLSSEKLDIRIDELNKIVNQALDWWRKTVELDDSKTNLLNQLLDHGKNVFGNQNMHKAENEINADHVTIVRDINCSPNDLWFFGDLHGDVIGFFLAYHYISQFNKADDNCLVFLGDLFDRMDYSHELLACVFQAAERIVTGNDKNFSGILFLSGNHDLGLGIDDKGKFQSSVQPAEYSEFLNTYSKDDPEFAMGMFVINFFKNTSSALILPDGLLAAHGGFPAEDLWEKDENNSSEHILNKELALQDFVYRRLINKRRNRINRSSKSFGFGYQNFDIFCKKMSDIGLPVKAMIRGHDHISDRVEIASKFKKNPIATINTISCRLPDEYFGSNLKNPCVANWKKNQPNHLHIYSIQNPFSEESYNKIYKNWSNP